LEYKLRLVPQNNGLIDGWETGFAACIMLHGSPETFAASLFRDLRSIASGLIPAYAEMPSDKMRIAVHPVSNSHFGHVGRNKPV
jgi:hypothetical protein